MTGGRSRSARAVRAARAASASLRVPHDAPGGPVSAPRAAQDAGREGGHARDRVGRGHDAPRARRGHRVAQPGAADRERGAVVAQQGAEAAFPREAPTPVAPERDRAGAREQQHAGDRAERGEVGGLDVRDHDHARGEAAQAPREGLALAARPDPARGHAERGQVAARQAPAAPEASEQRGQARHARRRPPVGPRRRARDRHAHPGAAQVHHRERPSAARGRRKHAIHGRYCPPAPPGGREK